MSTVDTKVVVLSGPSGSGKSYIAERTGLPVLALDDFYKDGDDPSLPRLGDVVDWESPHSWDSVEAIETIARLARIGRAEVPVYAIGADRRVATKVLDLVGSPLFVAEGIFAADIVGALHDRGLLAGAYALRRPRAVTFARRLTRDLVERRKPPLMLVRRGLALMRAEPTVLARQTALGCEPKGGDEIVRAVRTLLEEQAQRRSDQDSSLA